MAKSIGSLWAKLGLDDKKFTRGIKNSKRSLQKFGRNVKSFGRTISVGIVAPLAALAGVASFGMLIKTSLMAADTVGKLADRLNISTEALTGLQHAALLTGTNSEVMNRALERMIINLGKAARGDKVFAEHMDRLGININKLKKLGAGEQFREISDGIAKLGSQVERAAIASDIFGRSGARMLNLLVMGSKNIKKLETEALDLGLTFSRIETKTIEEANDNFIRMKTLITAVGNRIAVFLAPHISEVTTRLVKAANAGASFRSKIEDVIKVAIKGFGRLRQKIAAVEVAFHATMFAAKAPGLLLITTLEKVIDTLWRVNNAGLLLGDIMSAVFNRVTSEMTLRFRQAINYMLADLNSFTNNPIFKLLNVGVQLGYDKDAMAKATQAIEKANKRITIARDNMSKAYKKGFKDETKEAVHFFAEWQDQVEDSTAETAAMVLDSLRRMGDDKSIEIFLAKLEAIKTKWEKIAEEQVKAMKKMTEAGEDALVKKLPKYAEEFEKTMSGIFKKLLVEGNFTFQSLAQAFVKAGLNKIFTQAASGMASGLTNLFARPSGGGLATAAATAGGTSGGTSGVGGGAIISGTRGVKAPVQVIQNMSFGEGVNDAARAAVVSSMPAIAGAAKGAVNDANRRRGE